MSKLLDRVTISIFYEKKIQIDGSLAGSFGAEWLESFTKGVYTSSSVGPDGFATGLPEKIFISHFFDPAGKSILESPLFAPYITAYVNLSIRAAMALEG